MRAGGLEVYTQSRTLDIGALFPRHCVKHRRARFSNRSGAALNGRPARRPHFEHVSGHHPTLAKDRVGMVPERKSEGREEVVANALNSPSPVNSQEEPQLWCVIGGPVYRLRGIARR